MKLSNDKEKDLSIKYRDLKIIFCLFWGSSKEFLLALHLGIAPSCDQGGPYEMPGTEPRLFACEAN